MRMFIMTSRHRVAFDRRSASLVCRSFQRLSSQVFCLMHGESETEIHCGCIRIHYMQVSLVYNHHHLHNLYLHAYFFPKNDMIFPCPAFTPAFFGALTAGFFLGGGASSSEKDSHAGSSTVTRPGQLGHCIEGTGVLPR